MVNLDDLVQLFDDFWYVDKHLPSVKPPKLKMQMMKWEYPEEFSDKVNKKQWKNKEKPRAVLLSKDYDQYWIATQLGLTLPSDDRKLVYIRHQGNSYRKLGKLYGVSHESIRNKYLGILIDLQNKINKQGSIKDYLYTQSIHN